MARIIAKKVVKAYEKPVLGPLSFTVEQGTTLAILGPSGSGKSTLLKGCAGLLTLEGELKIENHKRQVVVFDEPMCLNHLSVKENIILGMKKEGYSELEIEQRLNYIVEQVDLQEQLFQYPDECSHGQRQRIGLARALIRDFDVLLMDEPFSALDILLRKQMLELISKLQHEKKFTCMYVTHDHRDAKVFADQVMILKEGHIEMLDTYENCVAFPKNEFVRAFLG